MNKQFLIPLSMGALAAFNAKSSDSFMETHQVKEGECLSSIVMEYAFTETKNIRYTSRGFREAFKQFEIINPQVQNVDLIYTNQKINIPVEYGRNSKNIIRDYKVKYGDTAYKILKEFISNENPWNLMAVLKNLNPNLKGIGFIKEGDLLKVPTVEYLSSLRRIRSEKRIPASSVPLDRKRFSSNFLIERDMYYLSSDIAQEFVEHFRSIVNAKNRLEVMVGLKNSLNLSRDNNKRYLEESILFLISSTLKSKESDEIYLVDIRVFFETWKTIRKLKIESDEENF